MLFLGSQMDPSPTGEAEDPTLCQASVVLLRVKTRGESKAACEIERGRHTIIMSHRPSRRRPPARQAGTAYRSQSCARPQHRRLSRVGRRKFAAAAGGEQDSRRSVSIAPAAGRDAGPTVPVHGGPHVCLRMKVDRPRSRAVSVLDNPTADLQRRSASATKALPPRMRS